MYSMHLCIVIYLVAWGFSLSPLSEYLGGIPEFFRGAAVMGFIWSFNESRRAKGNANK